MPLQDRWFGQANGKTAGRMHRFFTLIRSHSVAMSLITLLAITVLSLRPLSQLPEAPGGDKAHHVVAYAVLMFPAALRYPAGCVGFGLFFIAYGGAMELIQPMVNRYGTWPDFFANVAGVLLGVLLGALVNRLILGSRPETTRPG